MKVTIDIDCTPSEAREFFGLPDVAPMQAKLVEELQERLQTNIGTMDAEQLMKTWMPMGLQGLDQLQKVFWSQMSQASSQSKSD
ncbi:MAG: DUF6489 family protein [Pseudomonadota bacterium]